MLGLTSPRSVLCGLKRCCCRTSELLLKQYLSKPLRFFTILADIGSNMFVFAFRSHMLATVNAWEISKLADEVADNKKNSQIVSLVVIISGYITFFSF